MNQIEPLIKLIPGNPSITSILIVYCYVGNRNIPCQVYWKRLTINSQQKQVNDELNPDSQIFQKSTTYKCSIMDYNKVVQIQAVCQFEGKKYKLKTRSDKIKATNEILQGRSKEYLNCQIAIKNKKIKAKIMNDKNCTFSLIIGISKFALQVLHNTLVIISKNSFSACILAQPESLVTFFMDKNQNYSQKIAKSYFDTQAFKFNFNNQIQRDLAIVYINESFVFLSRNNSRLKQQPQELTRHFSPKLPVPLSFLSNSLTKNQNKFTQSLVPGKKLRQKQQQSSFNFKTPDVQKASKFFQNHNNQSVHENDKKTKKKQSQEDEEGFIKKINFISNHIIEPVQRIQKNKQKSQSFYIRQKQKQALNQEFLNIFDDQQTYQQNTKNNQNQTKRTFHSSQDVVNESINNARCVKKPSYQKHVPSINLRSSFQQLQKMGYSTQNTLKQNEYQQNNVSSLNLIGFQRQFIYEDRSEQNLNNRNSNNEQCRYIDEIFDLKRLNEELKLQIREIEKVKKQSINIKRNYFQLGESIHQFQRQNIQLALNLKRMQEKYQKQKIQKQKILNSYNKICQFFQINHHELESRSRSKQQIKQKMKHLTESTIQVPRSLTILPSTNTNNSKKSGDQLSGWKQLNSFKMNFNNHNNGANNYNNNNHYNKDMCQTVHNSFNSPKINKTYDFEIMIRKEKAQGNEDFKNRLFKSPPP